MGQHHSHAEIDQHVKVYLKVFAALLLLTLITVAVSYLHVSIGWAVFIGLLVASIKGGLVAAFFMHLKDDIKNKHHWITKSLLLTAFFFAFMMAIILLSYANRLGV